jgi:hypothetical protein
MEKHDVWDLVELPPGKRAIGCKWVFRTKYNADGSIAKLKARICAKGYSQVEGVDYDETYAPVARLSSLRLLLSIAASFNLEVYQMDVVTAFLLADLDDEIYMKPPPGIDAKGLVCRLKKSLYGLKQAPHLFNEKMDRVLRSLGFIPTTIDAL